MANYLVDSPRVILRKRVSNMVNGIDIAGQLVGSELPPFIVAEVGINHNGSLERALEMISVAAQAGCNAVKFQTFKAAEFVNDASQMFTYKSQGVEVTESMLAMFERHELPERSWSIIKKECEREGIIFLSTPQNLSDLNTLVKLGIPAIKVGSDDFTNLPLIRDYSRSGLPLILSSGMSDLSDVYQALEVAGVFEGYPVILLVCTSQYPTPPEDANLRRISTLRAAFPMVPIGFSDHTQGSLASSLAVSLGAVFFEKHFTLSHDLPGPDHWFSEDPIGLANWVRDIKTAKVMLGSPLVRPTQKEGVSKFEFQRSIVASADIKFGEKFTEANLSMRRVSGGGGFPPSMYFKLLGKTAWRDFSRFSSIEF
ncbi:N-acetylneuraminate synthase family protein [Polynucleobacter sp. AP-Nino-20-G2]|uniref:N-acetylneuraminate synthase family protein n=1 Tax=Polynucleobacter sp. AP-Nino-20-G2 TaxID=2576917 RepID=UPI001BFE7023|nr:N-acetylneuraminate synthase family protein [Polynucleobacter sp. AP-Nino-20-G2]QWE16948.1 N-acetylneuraminate synthase family protein [Polynucleobacter sp. AP-Nino-20-G2]